MNAREALAHSEERSISTNTSNGVVLIHHHAATIGVPESFVLSFVPCDTHGHLNAGGTVRVGDHRTLESALEVAAEKYGVGQAAWQAAGEDIFRRPDIAYHYAPEIEQGRRFVQPEDVGEDGKVNCTHG